ncbi:MAG: CAP domain-containing protein [archaeon]|nr:CAP domain-containing protein [archaeon]
MKALIIFALFSVSFCLSNLKIQLLRNQAFAMLNIYRTTHLVPALKMNSEMNQMAQAHAEYLAKIGKEDHSGNKYRGELMGETVYVGNVVSGATPINDWYIKYLFYDFLLGDVDCFNVEKLQSFEAFTQMVWKSTTQVGFGIAEANGKTYFVANYYPRGNILGSFEQNVFKPF